MPGCGDLRISGGGLGIGFSDMETGFTGFQWAGIVSLRVVGDGLGRTLRRQMGQIALPACDKMTEGEALGGVITDALASGAGDGKIEKDVPQATGRQLLLGRFRRCLPWPVVQDIEVGQQRLGLNSWGIMFRGKVASNL